MGNIKLRIFGQDETYTHKELSEMIEEYLEMRGTSYRRVEPPMLGKWFRVYPALMNQKLFKEKREDHYQEEFRQRILDVFSYFKRKPELMRPFKTMVPSFEGGADYKSELIEIAEKYGDHVAEFFEQELEWAQRICNGESWEAVCNRPEPRGITYMVGSGSIYLVGVKNKNGTYKDIIPLSTNDLYCRDMKPLVVSYDL